MTVQVKGVLVNGFGQPLANTNIKVTSQQTAVSIINSVANYKTDVNGKYDFPLEVGVYNFEIYFGYLGYQYVGSVSVEPSTPSPITLDAILVIPKSMQPMVLIKVLQAVVDADNAASTTADEIRDTLAPLGQQYGSETEAQAAINAGTIKADAYFYIRSATDNTVAKEYQNSGGVPVKTGKKIASQTYIDYLSTSVGNLVSFITRASIGLYSGSDDFYPLLLDSANRLLLGYQKSTDSLIGAGLLNKQEVSETAQDTVDNTLGAMRTGKYTGAGNVLPLAVDKLNRVLLGYDVTNDKLVGAGLTDGGGSSSTIIVHESKDLPENIRPIAKAINIFMAYGQSLSVGATATTILSTSQPYSNTTFTSGPRAAGNDFSSKKPLVEDNLTAPDGGTNRGETVCSGAANYASTLMAIENGVDPASHVIFAHTAGKGGTKIADLSKGSTWYNNNFIGHITGANNLNPNAPVHAMMWIQGETDLDQSTPTAYQAYYDMLKQLQIDTETDIKALNGQTTPVHYLCYQTSYKARTSPGVSLAQLHLCRDNNLFHHVVPCYHLPFYTDGTHLTNIGYKWLGEYMGRAYKQLVIDGKFPEGIMPISATLRGTVLSINVDSTYPLTVDTTTLALTTNYGLAVQDSKGLISLSSISVVDRTITANLARAIVGSAEVRYGYDYLGAGLNIVNGGSGNIRDTDPETTIIGGQQKPLWRPCPHFKLNIIKVGE